MKRMVLRQGDSGVIRVETAKKGSARRYAVATHQDGQVDLWAIDERGERCGSVRVLVAADAQGVRLVHESPFVSIGTFEHDTPVEPTPELVAKGEAQVVAGAEALADAVEAAEHRRGLDAAPVGAVG